MSAPSPNRPRNIFGNTTNNDDDDTIPPCHATGVEPSPIAVVNPKNTASIPPTDEVLTSPTTMDYSLEYLCNVALNDQSPMAMESKYRVSAYPTQASPITNNVGAVTQQDEQATSKRNAARILASFNNKRRKVTIQPSTSILLFLREPYIESFISPEYTNSTTARGPNTKNNTKITSNASWKWDHKFNWGPFKPLEPKLKDAPIAISVKNN